MDSQADLLRGIVLSCGQKLIYAMIKLYEFYLHQQELIYG